MAEMPRYTFAPIGFVRSPFVERAQAPRQAVADGARGVEGTIELVPGQGFEDALADVETFAWLWVVFVFHRNVEDGRGWTPKVHPPRSDVRRGVFATRSPHRPNPIGLSAVKLDRVEGLALHVSNLDLLDGTPVLDLKPYLAYADAIPDASQGWLQAADPGLVWTVELSAEATAQLAWLAEHGLPLERDLRAILALNPRPSGPRRIRKDPAGGFRLGLREWRVAFDVEERTVRVRRVFSGYRALELLENPALALHRAYVQAFERGQAPGRY